ncbi:MAG: hypothetical protein A2589_02015 [Candidatus Vogelbacteria bacterium RIFOXYD1_FULL_46_19]|uniref:Uncharacterized protein n=1 Tax=Candidatus Vogelbacteria bacterium RIFOXYD1_FULL_46_19 TaxID=1802439 RepID=A0A1G2QG73_9BACT|nr:MAG: hypothetical protein A2589_02015 [Candidatus Vogelbacteria bacterium RIFOXYD1_FULL_46_19]
MATVKPQVQTSVSREVAREVLSRGTDCLDDLIVEKAFGIPIFCNDFPPPIPFGPEEIDRARKLHHFLVLIADKNPAGQVLTMQGVDEMCQSKLDDGPLLFYRGCYKHEPFYGKVPIAKFPTWKFVSREVIPDSINKNFLGQTQAIVDYLVDEVYEGQSLPDQYRAAVDEFEANIDRLASLMNTNWQPAAGELAALQVNQLFRLSPGELLYVIALYDRVNHERLLEDTYSWTASRYADGNLVSIGLADSDGASVDGDTPRYSYDNLGTMFSRSGLV